MTSVIGHRWLKKSVKIFISCWLSLEKDRAKCRRMTASVSLVSRPYLGIPIEVVVTNTKQPIDAWNYVALTKDDAQKTRIAWEWVKDLKTHKVTLPQVADSRAGIDTNLVLQYYVNGGYLATGDLAASLTVTLKNPLRKLTAAQNGGQVSVATELEIVPSSAMLRLAADGIRLSTLRVDREGSFQLPAPRVSGMYDVSFLSGIGNDMSLGSVSVQIAATEKFSIGFSINESIAHAAVVAPNALTRVVCGGGALLRGKDAIFLHRCSDGNISSPPSSNAFQTPLRRCEIDGMGRAEIQLREEGIYHVSLALYHEAGTYLCGGRALLVVSPLASPTHSTVSFDDAPKCLTPRATAPPSAEPASSNGSTDERVLCIVCRDQVIQIKFDPCKHVIVCEGCHAELARRGHGELCCPMCRARVTSVEKVFIP